MKSDCLKLDSNVALIWKMMDYRRRISFKSGHSPQPLRASTVCWSIAVAVSHVKQVWVIKQVMTTVCRVDELDHFLTPSAYDLQGSQEKLTGSSKCSDIHFIMLHKQIFLKFGVKTAFRLGKQYCGHVSQANFHNWGYDLKFINSYFFCHVCYSLDHSYSFPGNKPRKI